MVAPLAGVGGAGRCAAMAAERTPWKSDFDVVVTACVQRSPLDVPRQQLVNYNNSKEMLSYPTPCVPSVVPSAFEHCR